MEKQFLEKAVIEKYEPLTQRKYPDWMIFFDRVARRIIDLLVSFFGLLFSLPWFLIVGTIIKRDTPGPIFFHGKRVGRNRKTFKILKFRTMYEKPESYNGKRLTVNNDPRITEVGRWLRDSKMNELPQLWNVFLGQMSLVGPRPEDPQIFEKWPEKFKAQYQCVRPGMTSPASLMFFDEENSISSSDTEKDYLNNILPFKLGIDFDYLKHRTIINDLDILFMTFIALFPRMREQRIKESNLDKGPLISFLYGFFNWFLIDLFVSVIATSLSIIIWRFSMPLNIGFTKALLLAFLLALGFSFTNVIFGLNRIAWRHAPGEAIMDVGISTALTTILISFANMLIPSMNIPLGILILTGALSFIGFSMTRYRERLLTGFASRWLKIRSKNVHVGERAIIIGAGELGVKTSWYIKHGYLNRVLSVVGFVDDNVYKENLIFDRAPVLGQVTDLPELVDKHQVDILIFAIERISKHRHQKIESVCAKTSAQTISARHLLKDPDGFIGPKMMFGEIAYSKEDLQKIFNELDSYLQKEDLSSAHALVRTIKQNMASKEGEKL